MRPNQYTFIALFFFLFCQISIPAFSQLGISFNLKKPKQYDDRLLRSEKSGEKKFTLPRRLIQNTVTHYNYFFNANNKLNEVLEAAKSNFKDDYSQLLPFYNYSLDATQRDSIQLDSITYKSSTAIAIHDLRNDWVDNMYLLWGAAYYFQKDFDSAYLMFQFINYAFAPKDKDGYYKTIGSKRDGNSAFSISSKEKNSLPRRIFSEPPSRNDAFIWQIRNFLAQDQSAEAASLIVTLKSDPNFPKRLRNDLDEVQAFWFYKQNMWDSAAAHLVKALDNASNAQEKARWEYLAAQLFELSGNYAEAENYFIKASKHTTDPILDIYARLYQIRVNKDDKDNTLEKNVAELLKMAKQDKYEDYRDIIYYMASQMQLEGNNIDEAMALLLKSTQYTSNNPSQRNKAFLKLAEIAYAKKDYRKAYNFYDSLNLGDPSLKDIEGIKAKKNMLGNLAVHLETIAREDSLQKIAALTEDERKEFVKKLVRQLRKEQGLKEEATSTGGSPFTNAAAVQLFPTSNTKGEWYFYNADSRTRGQSIFKSKWGSRPNADNWRRAAVVLGNFANIQTNQPGSNQAPGTTGVPQEISYDLLYANLPISSEQLKKSNDTLRSSLFNAGKVYIQEIEDCKAGTETLEQLRNRFPSFEPMDEVLFNLYFCYNKNGESAKANAIKRLLNEKFPGSNFTTIVTTGKNPKSTLANTDATKKYERIYDMFIEGQFAQAIAEKNDADKLYGKSYWTPQLLYIEAVYYIKQREDSTAKNVLNDLITQFTNTPMADKATNLLSVLNKRKQIEEELQNLVVTRMAEDSTRYQPTIVTNKPTTTIPPVDSVKKITPPVVNTVTPPKDSVITTQVLPPTTSYRSSPNDPHYVVLMLNKIDPVFINEAKNAFIRYNKETYYNKIMSAELAELDVENKMLLISPFKDAAEAMSYIDQTKPKTSSEIIPWLKGGKYSFIILTENNFNLLKASKDLESYKSFLNQQFPGKF